MNNLIISIIIITTLLFKNNISTCQNINIITEEISEKLFQKPSFKEALKDPVTQRSGYFDKVM